LPRLTASKIQIDDDYYALPDKSTLLSGKGNTSLVYNHADPDKVIVYTIEAAKIHWWRNEEFIDDYQCVGSARLAGWSYNYRSYEYKKIANTFDVYRCEAPRVSFNFPVGSRIWRQRIDAIGAVEAAKRDATLPSGRPDIWRSNVWANLSESPIDAVVQCADYALSYGSDMLYAENKRDAYCVWNGELFWLDPYHAEDLSKYLRASHYYPNTY